MGKETSYIQLKEPSKKEYPHERYQRLVAEIKHTDWLISTEKEYIKDQIVNKTGASTIYQIGKRTVTEEIEQLNASKKELILQYLKVAQAINDGPPSLYDLKQGPDSSHKTLVMKSIDGSGDKRTNINTAIIKEETERYLLGSDLQTDVIGYLIAQMLPPESVL